jgi:tRNA pseudouridine32 synthase/23S rRNA pseudouridine746 synthase
MRRTGPTAAPNPDPLHHGDADPEPLDEGWVYAPPTGPLVVVHADRDLVVIHKPSGLLSAPGRGPDQADSALLRVQARWPTAEPVHRLDLDTSGLLVFALRGKATRALMAQLRDRAVQKRYLAWVAGAPGAEAGEIDLPLRRLVGQPRSVVDPAGRPSRTRWRVLERRGEATLLALEPLTGRSHQLRLHLRSIGHPILGDRFYAPPEVILAADRLLLHAVELRLLHPWSGAPLALHAPPGPGFGPR